MRIAYAVHGHGRGHATRAAALLPQLADHHQVMVLAGGDAYSSIWPDFPIVRIPTLGFAYGQRSGQRCNWRTFKRNLPAMIDLSIHGPVFGMIADALEDFAPDVVISDAEGWSHRVARSLKIPRISIDHIGILEYCRPPIERRDHLESIFDRWCYRRLMCEPERVIVSSFYRAAPRRAGVMVVGTMCRQAVRDAAPSSGKHLLVYLNQGRHQLLPRVVQALAGVGCPVHIYGTSRRDREGNLRFCPTSNLPFIEDLASCRAVIATAGNQLMGEAIWLGKPMLVIPERCVEQRLNAAAVERLGVGMRTTARTISTEQIRALLDREDEFIATMKPMRADGVQEALEAIEQFLVELAPNAAAAGNDGEPSKFAVASTTS